MDLSGNSCTVQLETNAHNGYASHRGYANKNLIMISPQCGQITSKELVINAKVFRKQARPAQEDFVVTGRSAPSQVCRINRVFVADSERMSFLRNPVHETKS